MQDMVGMAGVPAFPSSGERRRTLRPIRRAPCWQPGGKPSFFGDARIMGPRSPGRRDVSLRSRDTIAPEFCRIFTPKDRGRTRPSRRGRLRSSRGRREDRVRAAPAVSCAIAAQETSHTSIQVQRRQLRPSPRNGFTVSFVLSPVTGLLATVALAPLARRDLTPASGRQDHTTSPYAASLVRPRA